MVPDYEDLANKVVVEGEEPERELTVEEARQHYPIDHPKYQGIGEAKGYDQSYARLKRTHYSHEAMVDVIIANPNIKQNELAAQFGKSVPWISRILGSDAFQACLHKRREELTDPFLVATIEERFRGLAMQSLDIITEKLEASKSVDLALKGLEISAKSLGFGARDRGGNNQQNNFTIVLPPKAPSADSWAAEHNLKRVGNG